MEVNQLEILLQNLSRYFDVTLSLEDIEELYELHATRDKTVGNIDKDLPITAINILSLDIVTRATKDFTVAELLLDICNDARDIRTRAGFYNNNNDNWEFISQKINVKSFLSFIYCMTGLSHLKPLDEELSKITLNAARSYLLLLTTPGAKRCRVFDNNVVISCLHAFKVIEKARPKYKPLLLIQLTAMLEDLKTVFKIVCLDLEEYKEVKEEVIVTIRDLLLYNFKSNSNNVNLNTKCYEIFEILCLPIHGEVKNTINLILHKTSEFYKLEYKNTGIRFHSINTEVSGNQTVNFEKIWDFFIHLLDRFPEDTAEILSKFVKFILVNNNDSIRGEEFNHLLDICAKYESAIFRKCNISMLDFLEEYSLSADVGCRGNVVEFIGKMLLLDADVHWVLYQNEVSSVPREVNAMKILFDRIMDNNNTVKQKVLFAFSKIFSQGNKNVTKILEYGFHKNHKAKTTEGEEKTEMNGLDILKTDFKEFIVKLYQLRNNHLANIRRGVLMVIELLAEHDLSIITDDFFDAAMLEFSQDGSSLVRKQVIQFFNNLLRWYPNNRDLIDIWVRILLVLIRDEDPKICECIMESLKQNIFDNIVSYENSSQDKNYMPWLIVRSILKYGNRNILRTAIDSWIQCRFLTPKTLSLIESHIYTSNCTEAWILLSLISSKMKSKDPDMIVRQFNELIQYDIYDSSINIHLVLEVIEAWIKDFSRSALNQIFNILSDILKSGSSNVTLIQYIYDVCRLACITSQQNSQNSDQDWIVNLNGISKQYLINNRNNFITNNDSLDERYLNYMLIYSESNTDLLQHPDKEILTLLIRYLNSISNEKEQFYLDQNNTFDRKVNLSLIVLTRFAIRSTEIASRIVPEFDNLLRKKNLRDSTTKTLIKLSNDLCKRHTSLVESVFRIIVSKLNTPNDSVRLLIIETMHELILQDYLKMRGHILLNILATVVDSNEVISTKATALVLGSVIFQMFRL